MRGSKLLLNFALAMCWQLTSACAAEGETPNCLPMYVTSQAKLDFSGSWGKTDSGVITDRFVILDGPVGQNSLNGVDLSSYDKGAQYQRLADCGAKFAFLRIDSFLPEHIRGLRRAGIPYALTFDLQREKKYKDPATYIPYKGWASNLDKQDEFDASALVVEARKYGAELARTILARMQTLGVTDASTFQIPGTDRFFFAVDVEEYNPAVIRAKVGDEFGWVYAATIVAFAMEVQKQRKDLVPLLYTFPQDVQSFLTHQSRQDDIAMASYPVWLARVVPNAADTYTFNSLPHDRTSKSLQRFCLSGGGDRCIIQQYTHRGLVGFGLTLPVAEQKKPLPHHDMDRLFAVASCRLGGGSEFVRDEAARSRCIN